MRKLIFPLLILLSTSIYWSCNTKVPNRQLALELWTSFDEHYAFFELRGVNWKIARDSITAEAVRAESDSALFEVFCKYMQGFGDSHINLVSDSMRIQCNGGAKPLFFQEFPTDSSYQALLAIRDSTLAEMGIRGLRDSPSEVFRYGKSEDNAWGYLQIKRFYGISQASLEVELDLIFEAVADVEALIVDIRTNPGGNDPTALRVAEHFYGERSLGYFKHSRDGKDHEDFTALEAYWLEPLPEDKPYLGKVYFLTNGAAGSAADVFALLMYQRPNVVRVGTNTEGIFSDMYRDTLSNGWALTLSHQRYFSAQMEQFEKVGVPVEYEIANTKEDLARGFDPVIKTVEEIQAGNL